MPIPEGALKIWVNFQKIALKLLKDLNIIFPRKNFIFPARFGVTRNFWSSRDGQPDRLRNFQVLIKNWQIILQF